MRTDADHCLAAARSRDTRFDGWFVTAVTSIGICCRPSCPALTPKPEHLRFLPTAATAQEALACRRLGTHLSDPWGRRAWPGVPRGH